MKRDRKSDRAIAAEIGVSDFTVRKARKSTASNLAVDQPAKRVDIDPIISASELREQARDDATMLNLAWALIHLDHAPRLPDNIVDALGDLAQTYMARADLLAQAETKLLGYVPAKSPSLRDS